MTMMNLRRTVAVRQPDWHTIADHLASAMTGVDPVASADAMTEYFEAYNTEWYQRCSETEFGI